MNERHYGALQGLNKAETAEKHGDEQVLVWRSYDIPPPPMSKDDEGYAGKDRRYSDLDESDIPLTECLKDTVARFLPLWESTIAPQIRKGKNVLIAAHGNSLRALIKYLDEVSEEDILGMNVPTGMPLCTSWMKTSSPSTASTLATRTKSPRPWRRSPTKARRSEFAFRGVFNIIFQMDTHPTNRTNCVVSTTRISWLPPSTGFSRRTLVRPA